MTKGIFKKFAAVVLATSLVVGSGLTAFATDGTGSYEGGPMQYPTLSVTLPTVPNGAYNYIADPNGLIAATSNAKYADSTFTGSTGIFFLTTPKTDAEGSKNAYTSSSTSLELTNENAQDIDVTIKLEQKTAGSDSIAYSDTATFQNTDKDKKIYLAVTDGAETTPAVAALTSASSAVLTTTVEGNPDNYEPNYDATTEKYGYKQIVPEDGEDPLEWNSCAYNLTGALNTNAEWEDGLTFPAITVTWNYAEHRDDTAPSITTTSYTVDGSSDQAITVDLGAGEKAATDIASITFQSTSGATKTLSADYYTFEGTTLTIKKEQISAWVGAGVESRAYTVTFNDSDDTSVVVTLTKAD